MRAFVAKLRASWRLFIACLVANLLMCSVKAINCFCCLLLLDVSCYLFGCRCSHRCVCCVVVIVGIDPVIFEVVIVVVVTVVVVVAVILVPVAKVIAR